MKKISLALALLVAMPLLAQRASDLTPNTVKYKDEGLKNATGRSGSASIEARALLGSDGVTDVEVTTASFEATTAPGRIEKVQVKANADTDDADTRNFTNLGDSGFATVRLDTLPLARRQPVRIFTNVSGIDPSRTDVVTVDEIVKMRPDLSIESAFFPSQVIANHPAGFLAVIRERNGDVGARADCVLHVDGAVVDRATGIWVDAQDSVMCMMAYPLSTTGMHQLQITIENVRPGDWNPSNNASQIANVNVRSASELVTGGSYHATATEITTDSESFEPGNESQPNWQSYYSHNVERQGWTILDAIAPVQFDFSTVHASLAEWTGNEWLNTLEGGGGYVPSDWNCIDLRYGRTYTWTACKGDGLTTFFYWRGTTVARYYSRWWGVFTDYWTGDRYYFDHNVNMSYTFGPRPPYGDTASLEMIVNDGEHSWQIDPVMAMQPWQDPVQHNQGCYGDPAAPTCWTQTLYRSGKNGEDTEAND
jgi:hypothetical protein